MFFDNRMVFVMFFDNRTVLVVWPRGVFILIFGREVGKVGSG